MFDQSNLSVEYKSIGKPIIHKTQQLYKIQHFDSQIQLTMRTQYCTLKQKQQIQKIIKQKQNQQITGCMQILSYNFQKIKQKYKVSICLSPVVQKPLFSRLKKQILKQYRITLLQIKIFVEELIKIISMLEHNNLYRDINFWNIFEDINNRIFVGELTELRQSIHISSLYGCFIDYMSPERRCFQKFNPAKQMAWGLGLILLSLKTNKIVGGLNLKGEQCKKKLQGYIQQCRQGFGLNFYEIIKALLKEENKRVSCKQLKQMQIYKKFISQDLDRKIIIRFKSLEGIQIKKNWRELEIYECKNLEQLNFDNNQIQKLTIRFTKILEPENIWNQKFKQFHIIQCQTSILRIVQLPKLTNLLSLSLVNLNLKQSHLKILLKMQSQIKFLDLSINRQLQDYGFHLLITSDWIPKIKQLRMGGPQIGCGLTNQSITNLIKNKINMKKLLILDLSWNKVDNQALMAIIKNYEKFYYMKEINLSRSRIDVEQQIPKNIIII